MIKGITMKFFKQIFIVLCVVMVQDAGQTWGQKEIELFMFSYSTLYQLSGPYLMCAYSQGHHGEIGVSAKIFHID
jgi:hypothetical protein